jgi:glycosyltransferase involved in cell wall biosynthesis
MVGRIDLANGQDTFIKAAAGLMNYLNRVNVRAADGAAVKFVIVGEETLGSSDTLSDRYLEELHTMVQQFHLEGDVIFAGFQRNIPEVMSAFDIFVMPSLQETFGLVAIEAMAMECPVIISSGGSSNEIVGNIAGDIAGRSEFGFLMRPKDAFDLQQKLRYLIENPQERKLLGGKARKHVLAQYNRTHRVARTLTLYERSLRIRKVM